MEQVERRLLAILKQQDHLLDTDELITRMSDLEPGPETQGEARRFRVRRALISLARQGFICGLRGFGGRCRHWATPQTLLRVQSDHPKLPIVAHLKHGAEAYHSATRSRTPT